MQGDRIIARIVPIWDRDTQRTNSRIRKRKRKVSIKENVPINAHAKDV